MPWKIKKKLKMGFKDGFFKDAQRFKEIFKKMVNIMFGSLEKWFSKQKYCEKEKMQERGSLWIETMEEKGRKERNEQKKKMKKEKGRPKISPSPPPQSLSPFLMLSQLKFDWVDSVNLVKLELTHQKKKSWKKREKRKKFFFKIFKKN